MFPKIGKRMSPEIPLEAFRMHQAGRSSAEIAEHFGRQIRWAQTAIQQGRPKRQGVGLLALLG